MMGLRDSGPALAASKVTNQESGTVKNEKDDEEAIRAKYRLMVQEKVMRQVQAIKDKEDLEIQRRQKEQKEIDEKKKKEQELKDKIAEEIKNIKELEARARERMTAASTIQLELEDKPPVAAPSNEAPPSEFSVDALKHKRAMEAERLQAEAKLEVERMRIEAEAQAQKRKKEAEAARQKAIQDELKRLMEEDDIEKEQMILAEKKKREQEERKLVEQILERRRKAEEEIRAQRRAFEEERIRENEILKKKMAEEKKNRFKDPNQTQSLPIRSPKELPKRRKLLDNPILNKFEAQAKLPEAEEAIRKAQIESKRRAKPFQLIKDKIKNTSRNNLDKLRRSRQTLGSRLSKEKLKTGLKTSRDQLNQEVAFAKNDDDNFRKTNMKNYLLSQVLYDGQAEVKAASKCYSISETTTSKSREQSQNQREIERRRKEFELYKQEMEKYLSLFENSSEGDQVLRNKASKRVSSLASKPIHNINNIKELFESRNGPQQATAAKDVPKSEVGKLDTPTIFAFQEERPKPPTKMDYVPVVIDKEAFERTMNKFEMYKQEEEQREERIKEIQARGKLKEAQLGEAQEMSEDEEEAESDEENELGGLTSSDDDEMDEEEYAKEQKIYREWSLKQKVAQEIRNLKDLDEELMNKSAKENRRREILKQAQSEIESITRPDKRACAHDKKEDDDDDTPQWIRMIMEMVPRQNFDRMEDPVQNDIQSEISQDQGSEMKDGKRDGFAPFEESVNALMSLIDDKDELSHRKKSSLTSSRRPKKLNMEDFSFESSSQNQNQKSKSTVTCEANIKEVKEQLLRKNSSARFSKANEQAKVFLGRACNDIKRSLTRRNQETQQSTPPRRLKRRKSIIQFPEFEGNPKANYPQPKKIWSYQNRTMKELYDLVNHRSDKVSSDIATRAEHILEQSKTLEQAKSDLSHTQDQPLMLYTEFLSNIENYLKKNKANSVKNFPFDDNLKAYLDLIQGENSHERGSKLQNTQDYCISLGCNGASIRGESVPKPFEDSQSKETWKCKQIGKLSEEQLNVIKSTSKNNSVLTTPVTCEALRSTFESNDQETKNPASSNKQWIKLVHFPMDQTNVDVKSSQQRDHEWKSKQAPIQELLQFVQINSSNHAPELEKSVRKSLNVEQLELREKEIQKLTSQRDTDFEELMQELEIITNAEFKDKPEHIHSGSFEMEHVEALKSESLSSESDASTKNFSLPKLRTPWKIADIKGKFAHTQRPTKVEKSDYNVGKLEPRRIKAIEAKNDNSFVKQDQNNGTKRNESVPINEMRNKYELNQKAHQQSKEVPQVKRRKVLMDSFRPQEGSGLILGPPKQPKQTKIFPTQSLRSLSKLQPSSITETEEEKKPITRSRQNMESWQEIDDPEERKRAILAKYGLKPVRINNSVEKDDLEDLDTIPSHILNDEILYRKYMRQQIADQFTDHASSSDEEDHTSNVGKKDTGMSLTNLLSAMRSSSIRKAGAEAKVNYRKALQTPNILANIPGTCSSLKQKFETNTCQMVPKSKCRYPVDNEKNQHLNLKGFRETQFRTDGVSKESRSKPKVGTNGSQGTALKRFKSAIQLEQSHPKIDLVKQFFRNGLSDCEYKVTKIQTKEGTLDGLSPDRKCLNRSKSIGTLKKNPFQLGWKTDSNCSTKHNLKWQTEQHIPDVNVRAKRFQYERLPSTESLSFGNMETELNAIREIRRNPSQDGQSYENTTITQVCQAELDHVREVRRHRSLIDFEQPSQEVPITMKHDTAMELEAIRCWRESKRAISVDEPVKYSHQSVVQRELEALRRLRQQYPNVCEADCEVAYHNAALQKELQFIGHLRQKFNFQERLPPQTHDQRDIIQRELAALNYARKHLLSKANIEPDVQNVQQQNTVQRELEALRKLQKIGAFSPQGLFPEEATNTAIKRELEMVSLARQSVQYDPQDYSPINRLGREGINQELEVLRRSKSCQQFNFESNDAINPQRFSIAQELANIKEIRNSVHFTDCLSSSLSQQEVEAKQQQRRRDTKQLFEARDLRHNLEESETNECERKLTERQRINNELKEIRALRRSKSCNVSANPREDCKTASPQDGPNKPMAMSERDRIRLELEELRQIRRNSAMSKINRGREDSQQISSQMQRAASLTSLETGNDAVDSSSRSNDMIRAMFESQAPKIRFGGRGHSMSSMPQITKRKPVKARKVQDKRKWVHDTVNKYFNVILEEQEEEDDMHCSARKLSNSEADNQSIFYPDTDSEDETGTPITTNVNQATSSTRLREMFHSTLNKVSNNLGTSKEILLERFKSSLSNTLKG